MGSLITDEHKLVTPRRNFLIRALGFTAAGASVTIPIVVADDPLKRIEHHMQGLTAALQELYPDARLSGAYRVVEHWKGPRTFPGDILATVRADGIIVR